MGWFLGNPESENGFLEKSKPLVGVGILGETFENGLNGLLLVVVEMGLAAVEGEEGVKVKPRWVLTLGMMV